MKTLLFGICATNLVLGALQFELERVPGQAPTGVAEIHGLAASEFSAAHWQAGSLHFVPDARRPLIAPRWSGGYRNIYAPSAVEMPDHWRVFYGAWDGVDTGNDRIYSVTTKNFLDFDNHQTVIEHGDFIHCCNVNVLRNSDGSFDMACTVYPDPAKLNKPAVFRSRDGEVWNGSQQPYPASLADIVSVEGYPGYPEADINGMNVLFRDPENLYLYFNNFKDIGRVYRARNTSGNVFIFEGPVLETEHVINDIKTFRVAGQSWHLMGLHGNRSGLWYALSQDAARFGSEQTLFESLDSDERYIVALGWVRQSEQLLGVLYGAGAVPSLDRNRIFARWLQKRLVLTLEDGTTIEPAQSLGPDRQWLDLPAGAPIKGKAQLFAEDGKTLIAEAPAVTIQPNVIYRIRMQ